MTTPKLQVVNGGKPAALDRVIATARRMQEHEEIDRWEFSDDVAEAVVSRVETVLTLARGNRHQDSGLNTALEEVRLAIKRAGVEEVASIDTVRGAYHTARAWPATERVAGANYWAHYELRAREYDGRRQTILRRLVERSTTGHVGTPDVRLWKSSRKPAEMVPWLVQIDKGLRGVLNRKVVSWSRLSEDDRRAIVKMLQQIANEVSAEEFGR